MITIEEIRAKALEYCDTTGRRNAYECEECGSYIVTVDREPGVTPFMVSCGNCGAFAKSKFYRVQSYLEPTHEWYRPETLDDLKDWERQHVENGGLLLRAIDDHKWLKPDAAIAELKIDYSHFKKLFEMKRYEQALEDRMKGYRANLIKPQPAEPAIKREDYPSRQAYRHALAKQGRCSG